MRRASTPAARSRQTNCSRVSALEVETVCRVTRCIEVKPVFCLRSRVDLEFEFSIGVC